jgi:hypothetical protein
MSDIRGKKMVEKVSYRKFNLKKKSDEKNVSIAQVVNNINKLAGQKVKRGILKIGEKD